MTCIMHMRYDIMAYPDHPIMMSIVSTNWIFITSILSIGLVRLIEMKTVNLYIVSFDTFGLYVTGVRNNTTLFY